MKNEHKYKYIPCTLKIIEFSAERGFASSMDSEKVPLLPRISFFILKNEQTDPNGIRNQQYQPTWTGNSSDFWESNN